MKHKKKIKLLSDNIFTLYLHYLFPSVMAAVMISINYFIDALCIGQKLGSAGLSALSLASPIAGMMIALGVLFGIGGSTLFSLHLGQNKKRAAQEYYTLSFVALLLLSFLLGGCGMIFIHPLIRLLGGGIASYQGTLDYLRYMLPFAPIICLEAFLSIYTTNDQSPRISMAATLISCLINCVLDVLFVFFFEWGMAGASLSTSLSTTIGFAILMLGTLRKTSKLRFRRIKLKLKHLLDIIYIGIPSFVQQMTPSLVALTFNHVLLVISGEMAVGVYGIINNVAIIANAALNGTGEAMQPIVSANTGAEKHGRVRKVLQVAFICSLIISMVLVVICELFPRTIVRLFIQADQEFAAMAVSGLCITSLSFIALSVNVLLTIYFQAVNASSQALLLSLMRGVALPLVSILFCALFFGVTGVWASIVVSEVLSVGIALCCLRRVQMSLRMKNYQKLRYFAPRNKVEDTLDDILYQLGAEELSSYIELIHYCNSRDETIEGIPAYIGLDDLTSGYEGEYQCAQADEGYGLWLATSALLFTDLFEQNEEYMKEKLQDMNYPAAAPAMSALAEQCFEFEYDEKSEKTKIISYQTMLNKALEGGVHNEP